MTNRKRTFIIAGLVIFVAAFVFALVVNQRAQSFIDQNKEEMSSRSEKFFSCFLNSPAEDCTKHFLTKELRSHFSSIDLIRYSLKIREKLGKNISMKVMPNSFSYKTNLDLSGFVKSVRFQASAPFEQDPNTSVVVTMEKQKSGPFLISQFWILSQELQKNK